MSNFVQTSYVSGGVPTQSGDGWIKDKFLQAKHWVVKNKPLRKLHSVFQYLPDAIPGAAIAKKIVKAGADAGYGKPRRKKATTAKTKTKSASGGSKRRRKRATNLKK